MNRWTMLLVMMVIATFIAISCSGGGGNPVTPTTPDPAMSGAQSNAGQTQTHLWGYYDVHIDIENQTVEAVPNRNVMFAANVVTFMNGNPEAMIFNINSTAVEPDHIDVDIDVGLAHPLPGMMQYNGYDVRGIFVADGSGTIVYDTGLSYAQPGTDQYMFNADGYSRWWNPDEFTTPGALGYTPGDLATPGFSGDATLNPYKYFADGLGATDDLWTFLGANAGDNGVFTSGSKNTRNYVLRFPTAKKVTYGYAIVANWGGEDPAFHPSNANESVAVTVAVTDDIYYVDAGDWGGNLILDISIHGWEYQPSVFIVESNIFNDPQVYLNPASVATGGGVNYSTYHIDLPAETLEGVDGNEYWVICQYDGFDYSNDFGVTNGAGDDYLSAFFRYCLFVADQPYNTAPVVDSGVDGEVEPFILDIETYTVTAHDVDLDPLTFSWTVTDNATSTPVTGYDGVPGDGAGNLDVDWAAVGAANLDEYDIDCEVDDSIAPPVPATTLTVTCNNVIFYDDMESGEGGWTYDHSGPVNDWAIVSGGNDGHWWHMNNGAGASSPGYCARLFTPEISIPSGVSEAYLEIHHQATGLFASNTVYVGPALLKTTNSGASINKVVYPVVSGPQYTNWNYPYTSTYHFGLAWVCAPFNCWGVPSWTTVSSPTTNVVDVSGEIGNTLKFAFMYGYGLWYYGAYVWAIDDVKVTVVP